MEVLAPKFDAIVALGGGVTPTGELSQSSILRTDAAVRCFGHGWADYVIFSGGGGRDVREADAMEQRAISLGLDPGVIQTETTSKSTIGNAYSTKKHITDPEKWHNLLVVTNDQHVPRAKWVFEHVLGIKTLTSPYALKVIGEPEPCPPLQYLQEPVRLLWNGHLLRGTQPGDEESIREQLKWLDPKHSGKPIGTLVLHNAAHLFHIPAARIFPASAQTAA